MLSDISDETDTDDEWEDHSMGNVNKDEDSDFISMTERPLKTLRRVIMKHGESYPEFGETVPIQYIKIQEEIGKIRSSGKRVIPYTLLEKINSALEEPLSKQELELFVQFQHNCGFILHFNDIHLKHILVLDPKIIIDATKSIVTSKRFAMDVWNKEVWNTMVTTGKVDESYILHIWKGNKDGVFDQHKDYLLRLLQRLDIISKPKIYDHQGFDASVKSYYVPCMLQAKMTSQEIPPRDIDITISFVFKDLLPPAVVHKVFASCLSLWTVEANCLYDGWAALGSGPNHLLLLKREAISIRVSIRHRKDDRKIDNNLVKSITQFFDQTIWRIVCYYGFKPENNAKKVYEIEYNQSAISIGAIGVSEERSEVSL